MSDHVKMTRDELHALLRERFGDDPMDWAFVCPSCGDVATGQDFRAVLQESVEPRTRRDGSRADASDYLGQQCIGRILGALEKPPTNERGCDWTAFGLIRGPWEITTPGRSMWCFPVAEAA